MTFQVGEKVVYPNHGVGTIENISTRAFGPTQERFYLLRLTCNGMTVMVPFSHVADLRLRKLTKAAEVQRILTFLAEGECRFSHDWKLRFKVNTDKMSSGSLLDITEVFKALATIQAAKPLSFREKKMLERARQMLVAEVSVSRGIDETAATELLRKSLGKAGVPLPEPM